MNEELIKDSSEEPRPTESLRLLVTRPVEDADLNAVIALAREVNIASMVPEAQASAVWKSQSTLNKNMLWSDGLVFFVTDMFSDGDGGGALIGMHKLNKGAGGYWILKTREGYYDNIRATYKYLTFENLRYDECAFEFASNVVTERLRGKGVGDFHAQARALFLLMHHEEISSDASPISFLFANLLTPESRGNSQSSTDSATAKPAEEERVFDFYKDVVQPFFGGKSYNYVDEMRYKHADFLATLILGRGGHQSDAPQIPVHLIPPETLEKLGVVRKETEPARAALEKLGFQRVEKYDALDGGQYIQIRFGPFQDRVQTRNLTVRRGNSHELLRSGEYYTFAPIREMSKFVCARALARMDEENPILYVDEIAFGNSKLDLRAQERVRIIASVRRTTVLHTRDGEQG